MLDLLPAVDMALGMRGFVCGETDHVAVIGCGLTSCLNLVSLSRLHSKVSHHPGIALLFSRPLSLSGGA